MDAKTLGDMPAHPVECSYSGGKIYGRQTGMSAGFEIGLTLRQHYAGLAMAALIQRGYDNQMRGYEGWQEEFSREALRFTDALLAELAKPTTNQADPAKGE